MEKPRLVYERVPSSGTVLCLGLVSCLACMAALVMFFGSDVSELITGAMQVQNGVKRFLQGNQLLTPLSVDKLAWITVSSPVGCQLGHM